MEIKMKTEYKKSSGFVYNKTHYVLKSIFSSGKFEKHSRLLLKQIEDTGYIIPANRSSKLPQMLKMGDLIDELKNKGIDIVSLANDILSDFGIEEYKSTENYFNYLEGILDKILYDTSPSFEAYGYPNYRYDNEKNPTELWIQIHPWTTKKVYNSYFPLITVLKGKLLNSIHKIKTWETFERDLDLYRLYLKVKDNIEKGILQKGAITGAKSTISRSPVIQMLDYPEYKEIKRKFPLPKFDNESVARLVSDTQKKLDYIQLL